MKLPNKIYFKRLSQVGIIEYIVSFSRTPCTNEDKNRIYISLTLDLSGSLNRFQYVTFPRLVLILSLRGWGRSGQKCIRLYKKFDRTKLYNISILRQEDPWHHRTTRWRWNIVFVDTEFCTLKSQRDKDLASCYDECIIRGYLQTTHLLAYLLTYSSGVERAKDQSKRSVMWWDEGRESN